jgi:hypothetical protein
MNVSKILLIATVFALISCETMQVMKRPKEIRGIECLDSPYMKVLQIVDAGILAQICPVNYPSYYDDTFEACTVKGDTVFMEVPKDQNDFVDNQKITLPKNQCFGGNGTYSYTSADGQRRTVRNIMMVKEEDLVPSHK